MNIKTYCQRLIKLPVTNDTTNNEYLINTQITCAGMKQQLQQLLILLLFWQYFPRKRTINIETKIHLLRKEINFWCNLELELKQFLIIHYLTIYELAAYQAALQLNIKYTSFLKNQPFTVEQVLSNQWLPEAHSFYSLIKTRLFDKIFIKK